MKSRIVLLTLGCFFFFCSFTDRPSKEEWPKTITRSLIFVEGREVITTVIVLDGSTTREEVIQTCNFLAKEGVQLTFEKLTIGRSFLGLFGKQRIRKAEGKIQLANGTSQPFKAGGLTSFKSLKIQYASDRSVRGARIEMIEIID